MSVSVISRGRGQSVVAAAAYRMGAALHDERYGVAHNFIGRRSVSHCEIMTPPGAPAWTRDRATLWNRVEARELRRDSQLARCIDLALPLELTPAERTLLLRDYVTHEFVARGMIADLGVRDDGVNPRASVLLTLRSVSAGGFGPKERRWNGKAVLLGWRLAWAETVNEHLGRAGHPMQIDHRSLAAQDLELKPARRVGIAPSHRSDPALPAHFRARFDEQQRIACENGATMLEDPTVALAALTSRQATFTRPDLERFLRSRTEDPVQYHAVLGAVSASPDLIALADGVRFTSRDMLEAQRSIRRRMTSMAARRGHAVAGDRRVLATAQLLSAAQRLRLAYLLDPGDVKAVTLNEDDKRAVLSAARDAWDAVGFKVQGTANSRRAAAALGTVCGVESRSLAEWEPLWRQGADFTCMSVLLVDGAHLLALKQLEHVLAAADRLRAKVVFIGAADLGPDSPYQDVLRLAAQSGSEPDAIVSGR